MATSTTVVSCPFRFYLLADNKKFVSRSDYSETPAYLKYYVQCKGETADAPQTVFEALSSNPESKSMVTWKHVETDKVIVQTFLLWLLAPDAPSYYTYFQLQAVDVKNNKAVIYVTLKDSVFKNGYLVRKNTDDGGGKILPDALTATARTISEATIFTVYDSALKKVFTEVVYDYENAQLQDVQPFESGNDILDNSEFDHTVVFHPSLTYSQTIDSNWSSSSTFGFTESITVTAKVPFASEVEVGFTAEQSFTTDTGGSHQISTQRGVILDVPVPPYRKVQVFVVGTTGKMTIPFKHKEISTYTDGSVRERIIEDGVCRSVSSTGTTWKVKYLDGIVMLSGPLSLE